MSETVIESRTLRDHVAEEVRALLGRRRMSSVALARSIGKSHTYVWRRLSGETAFDLDDLQAIAATLGVSPGSLLPRRGDTETSHRVLPNRQKRPADRRPIGRPAGSVRPNGQRRTSLFA